VLQEAMPTRAAHRPRARKRRRLGAARFPRGASELAARHRCRQRLGDVTLVEFFDYNCGYCKRALADVRTLVKADPKLRVC
jgi:protein-disulfide isomerase